MCECVSKKWETVPKRELNEDESMFFFGDEGIMGHLQLYLLNECYAHHCCQKDVIEGGVGHTLKGSLMPCFLAWMECRPWGTCNMSMHWFVLGR